MSDDLGFQLPKPAAPPNRMKVGAYGAVVLAILLAVGILPRYFASKSAQAVAAERTNDKIRVQVVTPKELTSNRDLVLPGTIRPFEETTLYPRAAGYVRRWLVDMGDRVKEGQLLAEVDTPELDDQLMQAQAQLGEAQANAKKAAATRNFSKSNLARYSELTPQGVTTQQDFEKQQAQAEVDEAGVLVGDAAVAAQRANVARLAHLKEFGRITAPFDGIVTARLVQRGALVGTSSQLFKMAVTSTVRVMTQVPQDAAPAVRAQVPAKVTLREFGARVFDGTISRSAGALDEATRTMTTEVLVPNPDNVLLPGMYANVALQLPISHVSYEIPATALMTDAKGTRVAVVGAEDKVELRNIVIEKDTGSTLQVSSGIGAKDRVIKVAGAHLRDGVVVSIEQ